MEKSSKILLAIAGFALIALGIVCFCYPVQTLEGSAWLLGCLILFSGLFTLLFTFKTQKFLPNSGTRMLSSLLQIFIGIFFLCNNWAVTASLPFVFAFWIMIEGVTLFIESFDFKKFGFANWWAIMILGIVVAVLGILGLRNPTASAGTLVAVIGIGLILAGVSYIVALFGINKFEKNVKDFQNQVKSQLNGNAPTAE